MNYLSHALSVISHNQNDDLAIIGSAIPDIRRHGFNFLHRKRNLLRFNEFVQKKYPEYFELARGIANHQTLDEITQKDSYFAQARREAAIELSKARISTLYSDMVVDMTLDLIHAGNGTTIGSIVSNAWEKLDPAVPLIMAEYTGEDKNEIEQTFSLYQKIMPLLAEAYKTTEGCAIAAVKRVERLNQKNKRNQFNERQMQEVFARLYGIMFVPSHKPLWDAIAESGRRQHLLMPQETLYAPNLSAS